MTAINRDSGIQPEPGVQSTAQGGPKAQAFDPSKPVGTVKDMAKQLKAGLEGGVTRSEAKQRYDELGMVFMGTKFHNYDSKIVASGYAVPLAQARGLQLSESLSNRFEECQEKLKESIKLANKGTLTEKRQALADMDELREEFEEINEEAEQEILDQLKDPSVASQLGPEELANLAVRSQLRDALSRKD